MKKITISLLTACLLLTFSPFQSRATTARTPMSLNNGTPGEPTPASKVLLDRLAEIQSLDKSGMSRLEKKALRKEARSIKKSLREFSGGGVYLSVGALLLVILLLVLLL